MGRATRYRVTEPLGRGARRFRGVEEAEDGSTRDVVIARLLPWMERFVEELRASLRLRHPNIIRLRDIARTPEAEYFAITEYIDGCDLKELVARRDRLAAPLAIQVVIECGQALECAHALGFVHRDVSPRALRVSTTGVVKLGDFGLAKVNSQIEATEPGVVKGKFGYLSPEAARGAGVDHRADVFAAGIVLWELLAGRRLFRGDTDYQTVELVRAAQVPAIDGLDRGLDTILRTALARDPDKRYQRATDFIQALVEHAVARHLPAAHAETAAFVREVQAEIVRDPIDPRVVDAFAADVRRLRSVVDEPTGS
jgi:serine/threonine-protein kinase